MFFIKFVVFSLHFVLFNSQYVNSQTAFNDICDVIDVTLLIDSSQNMGGRNFQQTKNFLINFITVLNVELGATRLAAVQAGPNPRALWHFTDSSDKSDLLRRVNSMSYTGGEQNLPRAANTVFTDSLTEKNGNRPSVPDVLIIFAGGDAKNHVVSQMRQLKERIRTVVVTVGIEADLQWKQLSSDPFEENFYNLDNAFHVVFLLQNPDVAQCANQESATESTAAVTTTSTPASTTTTAPPTTVPTTSTTSQSNPSSESPSCPNGAWTSWFDRDNPDELGDDESLWKLRAQYPGMICEWPTAFQARVVTSRIPLNSNSRSVFASHLTGLECLNYIGEPCEDYEIRFCCSSGGNISPFSPVRPATEGNTSETSGTVSSTASTTNTTTTTTSGSTPTTTSTASTEASISTTHSACPPGAWTSWYNNDNARSYAENESLFVHRSRHPDVVCEFPSAVEVRSVQTHASVPSRARNVFMSRITGFQCIKTKEETCEDHEIRFCCAREVRCFVGSKANAIGMSDNLLTEETCSSGEVCSEVTATMTTRLGGESYTNTNSIGLCMSRDACSNFSCEHLRNRFSSSSVVELRDCEARCCEGNLCNEPREPPQTTEAPAKPRTAEPGTQCYSGIEIGGSPELERYGVSIPEFDVVTCDPGQVCSTLVATPIFPRGRFKGTVLKKSQCLSRVACGSTNCEFVKSLLPKPFRINLVNCSSTCCDWGRCNRPQGVVEVTVDNANAEGPRETSQETPNSNLPSSSQASILPSPSNVSVPPHSEKFLPKCTVPDLVKSVFWCESLLSKPLPYHSLDTCRNKMKEVARCVEKQISRCARGDLMGKLDSLQLPGFNSKMILNFLREIRSDNPIVNNEINNFCFHAGYDYSFTNAITTRVPGCHVNFLTDIREQGKKFYYLYTWARHKGDICRAFENMKRWFLVATHKLCAFKDMDRTGYSQDTKNYLKTVFKATIKTLKKLKPLSCKKTRIVL